MGACDSPLYFLRSRITTASTIRGTDDSAKSGRGPPGSVKCNGFGGHSVVVYVFFLVCRPQRAAAGRHARYADELFTYDVIVRAAAAAA